MISTNSFTSVQQSASSQRTYCVSRSMKLKLIMGILILFILTLVFNVSLTFNSLNKLYLKSIISLYSDVGEDLQRNFEESLCYGKDVETFTVTKILEEVRSRIIKQISTDDSVSVSIALSDGSVKYSTDKELTGLTLPKQALLNDRERSVDKASSFNIHYIKHENSYIITMPVRHQDENHPFLLVIAFSERQIRILQDTVLKKSIRSIIVIAACGLPFLIIFNLMILNTSGKQEFPKRKIFIVIFITVILSQVIFSGLNINDFKNHYFQIHKEIKKHK